MSKKLYTLKVALIDGPVPKKFVKKNRHVTRTIEIRGDQTLADLHEIIFEAFDRFDEHLYEFQFGQGPRDRNGPRYRREPVDRFSDEDAGVGVAEETTLESLSLEVNRAFGYWFDFGDDWWHQIDVMEIGTIVRQIKYPKIIKRVGESPPQYPDVDELD